MLKDRESVTVEEASSLGVSSDLGGSMTEEDSVSDIDECPSSFLFSLLGTHSKIILTIFSVWNFDFFPFI